MSYSESFKKLGHEIIKITKELPKKGIWKSEIQNKEKIVMCKEWISQAADIYGVEVPDFEFSDSIRQYRRTGGGVYIPSMKKIILYKKFSIVTLLHEFRHHVQHEKNIDLYKNDIEEDARGWSVSLYKQALPKSYENAVQKGLLKFN